MVSNTTFSNSSVISWQSVLLGGNRRKPLTVLPLVTVKYKKKIYYLYFQLNLEVFIKSKEPVIFL